MPAIAPLLRLLEEETGMAVGDVVAVEDVDEEEEVVVELDLEVDVGRVRGPIEL